MRFVCLLLLVAAFQAQAQELWWGGAVVNGSRMPYEGTHKGFDLAREHGNNAVAPLFVSSEGRYIWSDRPFTFEIKDGVPVPATPIEAGKTLRDAFLTASASKFPPTGTTPDPLMFTRPQYNTWIELMYDQSEEGVLRYARGIIESGLPAGVLMIDDNWQRDYGVWRFRAEKFPDPRGMVDSLHALGFKVMVWVCPFVSPDSEEYRELAAKGFLIGGSTPKIIGWWNGQSACYDLTNPVAFEHFTGVLKGLQEEYGIDGFKLDAGDNSFYAERPMEQVQAWMRVGLEFPFNEYRAGYAMGGQPLVQRLGDKNYAWSAVQVLVPDMIAAGLLGYPYACPDMIGGGSYTDFMNIETFDQRLIVRSAQVHALMPMMQFSVAPWRILTPENMGYILAAAKLHERFGDYIMECARHASRTGEPIVRNLEYEFPHEGHAHVRDQFMLGSRWMVAPVVTPSDTRTVVLPRGRWRDDLGEIHRGGRTITVDAPLDRLPYYEKI